MRYFLFAVLLLITLTAAATQQPTTAENPSSPYHLGILSMPPFSFKNNQGEWDGLTVSIWKKIAETKKIPYQFVEVTDIHEALAGIKNHRFLTVISGLNITADREKYGAFSTPYYATEMTVGIPERETSALTHFMKYMTSTETALYILFLALMIVAFSLFIYHHEGHHNSEVFEAGKSRARNLGNSVIWSILLVTAQEGDVFKNKTFVVRLVSLLLFFVGVFTFSGFIAILTSSLTIAKIDKMDFRDLDINSTQVGVILDSRSQEYCKHHFISYKPFDNLADGVAMLKRGELEAILAQKVELRIEAARARLPLTYADIPNKRSYYAFFFRDGFDRMEDFNDAMAEILDDPSYSDLISRYIHLN